MPDDLVWGIPEKNLVEDAKTHLQNKYSMRDADWTNLNQLYWDEHHITVPEDFPYRPDPVRLGVASILADQVSAMFPDLPTLSVPVEGLSGAERERSSTIEVAARALLPLLDSEAGGHQFVLCRDDLVRLGACCMYMPPAIARWGETAGYPRQNDSEDASAYMGRVARFKEGAMLPFTMRHIPVEKCYPNFGPTGLDFLLVLEKRTRQDVASDPAFSNAAHYRDDSARLFEEVELCTLMNRHTIVTYASDTMQPLGPPVEHGLGAVPAVWGRAFPKSGMNARYECGVGVLHQIRELLHRRDALATKGAARAERWAWTLGTHTQGPQSTRLRRGTDGKALPPDVTPGQFVPLEYQEQVDPNGMLPAESESIAQLAAAIDQAIERKTGTGVLFGQPPPGVTAGYAVNSLIIAAASRYRIIGNHLADFVRDIAVVMLKHVHALDEPLRFYWRRGRNDSAALPTTGWYELKPETVAGNWRLEAKIRPNLPLDQAARMDMGARGQSMGWFGPEDAMEQFMDIEQPEVFTQRALISQVKQSDPVRSLVIQRVLQRAQAESAQFNAPPAIDETDMGLLPDAYFAAIQSGIAEGEAAQPALAVPRNTQTTPADTVPAGGQTSIRQRGRVAGADRRPGGPRRGQEVPVT